MAQKIASLFAEIGADTSKFTRGLNETKGGLTSIKADFLKFAAVATTAWIAINKALDATVGETVRYNKAIREMSQATGAGAEEMSRIVQVADDWGISIDQVRTSLGMMTKNGIAPSIDSLANLADEYVNTTDKTAFAEKASKLLGRQWQTLVPILAKGGDALREQAAAVDDSLIATEESIRAARDYEVALDSLNDQILALKLNIGNSLIPELVNLLPLTKDIVDWTTLETKTQKGVERQYAMVAGQLRDVTELYLQMTPAQLAAITGQQQLTAAVEQADAVMYDYVYRVTDVDREASRAAQAVTNFAIGIDKTAESADKAKGPLDDFLDGVDRNIASPIANFIKDLEWFTAGGGEIEAAFKSVQEALAKGLITPEQADGFAKQLLVAAKDVEVTLDPSKLRSAATDLEDTLGRAAANVAMKNIKGTQGIEGALQAVTGIQYYLNFKFQYSGTPPSAYTGQGTTVLPTGTTTPPSGPNPRAAGGPVMPNNAYLVGERGPELFVPNSAGNITPNNALGGGDVFADFAIYAAPGMSVDDVANAVVQKLQWAQRSAAAGGVYQGM